MVIVMNEMTIDRKALSETLLRLIRTEKITLSEADGEIKLRPVHGPADHIVNARGSLAAYPDLSVDKFLERKRAERELDL